ncbi:MAG: hypothetical protein ACJAWL_001816 [Motiliproteus sp.]
MFCYNHVSLLRLQLTDTLSMTTQAAIKGFMTGLSIALLSSTAGASTFNIGINNDTLDLGLKSTLSATSQFTANYLYVEDQGKALDLGWLTVNNTGGNRIAIGGKILKLWSEQRDNGHLLALGGDIRMPITPGLSAAIAGYAAPAVLSSSGIKRYYSIDAKLLYQLMPTADLYLGYRDVAFKFDNQPDQTLDQSFYLGAEVTF